MVRPYPGGRLMPIREGGRVDAPDNLGNLGESIGSLTVSCDVWGLT